MVILALLLMWEWRASLIQTASAAYVAVTGEVAPWLKNGDTDIATIVLSPDSVPAEEAPSLSGSKYAYSTLSEDGKLVYEGEYEHGEKNGKGTYYYPNGMKYEGEFVKNKKEGKGIFHWDNKTRWEGTFVDDKMDGSGTYYDGEDSSSKTYEKGKIVE